MRPLTKALFVCLGAGIGFGGFSLGRLRGRAEAGALAAVSEEGPSARAEGSPRRRRRSEDSAFEGARAALARPPELVPAGELLSADQIGNLTTAQRTLDGGRRSGHLSLEQLRSIQDAVAQAGDHPEARQLIEQLAVEINSGRVLPAPPPIIDRNVPN
jgi:hypothetical protein